jgi:DHA1 family inner membrane transport protein
MLANSKIPPELAVVLILTFGAFSLGMAEFTTIWLLPEMANSLDTTTAKIGPAASFYALGVLFGTPILALFGTTMPRQKLLTYLLLWCFAGNLATSFVSSYEQLKWVRFFSGVPHGVFLGISGVIFAQMLPSHQLGKAIGVLMAGIGVALLLIVPLTTYFGEIQDWRAIFRVVALMDLLIIILLHDLIPVLPQPTANAGWQELKTLRNPLLWWVLALSTTAICGRMAIFAYAAPLVTEVAMLPTTKLPLIVICGGIGTVVGFLLGGYFADKHALKTLCYSLVWCLLVMIAFQILIPHAMLSYLAFFLLGTFTIIVPALQVLSMRYAAKGCTFASCLNHSAMNAANAAGPILAGLFIGAGYGWMSVTWVGIIIGIWALVIYAFGHFMLVPKIPSET